jgi:hypothetical protein
MPGGKDGSLHCEPRKPSAWVPRPLPVEWSLAVRLSLQPILIRIPAAGRPDVVRAPDTKRHSLTMDHLFKVDGPKMRWRG